MRAIINKKQNLIKKEKEERNRRFEKAPKGFRVVHSQHESYTKRNAGNLTPCTNCLCIFTLKIGCANKPLHVYEN